MTDDAAVGSSGVPCATELVAFAEAAVAGEPAPLAAARASLLEQVGAAGLVDAAATVANFQRMVRIADGCGIPLDTPLEMMSGDFRSELGLDRFSGSAHSPDPGPVAKTLGRIVRPAAAPLLRLSYAFRDRFRSG